MAAIEAGRQAKALTAHGTAARHFALALELTREDDPERVPLLFDHAIALSHAGTPDEALFEGALGAQLAAEDWERAAWMENALAEWSAFRLGDGERADAHFARAATYSARVPTRPIAGIVAAARAYRLMLGAGRTQPGARVRDRGARGHIESPDGHALLLCRRGWARWVSATSAASRTRARDAGSWPSTRTRARPWSMRTSQRISPVWATSTARRRRSRMASEWAARSGEADMIGYVEIGQSEGLYHRGRWDEALRICAGATPMATELPQQLRTARTVRGRILLARGDVATAAADAGEDPRLCGIDGATSIATPSGSRCSVLALRAEGRERQGALAGVHRVPRALESSSPRPPLGPTWRLSCPFS